MTRHALREQVFRLLFRIDFFPEEDLKAQSALYLEDEEQRDLSPSERLFVQERYETICSHLGEIDAEINEKTTGWVTERMGKAELTILRLAVYEIRHDDTVPDAVAIDEAVELAKAYGQEDSPSFVNGVLARFVGARNG